MKKKNYPRAGHALIFLGSILVGASIFLIGIIFNINVDAHWLLLLWFVTISPMGYAFDSRPTIGLTILTFTYWLIISNTYFEVDYSSLFLLYLLFGIALYSIGQLHELVDKWSNFRMIYKGFGIFFILVSYLYFSLMPSNYYYEPYYETEGISSGNILSGIFVIIAIISIIANIFKMEKLRSTKYEFYLMLAAFIGWIPLFLINMHPNLIFGLPVDGDSHIRTALDTILSTIFSAFQIGLSIITVSIGSYKNEVSFVNIGIIFFALGVMQFYFNYLQGMLPKGVGLIISGIFLFIFATTLEKKRRVLLSTMGGQSNG